MWLLAQSGRRKARRAAITPQVSVVIACHSAAARHQHRPDHAAFARIVRGEGLIARRAQAGLLNAAKAILGNTTYERVLTLVLYKS